MNPPRASKPRATAAVLLAVLAGPAAAGDLLDIYRAALTQDPTYRSAQAARLAAAEALPQARAALRPAVDASYSTSATSTDTRRVPAGASGAVGHSTSTSDQFRLSLVQPLYRRDRWIALAQADASVARAEVDFASAGQALMLRTAERYFAVLAARDEVRFARATQRAFGEQLKQARQRFEVGLIAVTDVEEAKAGFDLAGAQIIAAENQLDTARESLRELTGSDPPQLAGLGAGAPLVAPAPDDAEQWTRRSLEENLAVRAARYAVEIAREEVERIKSGHHATVDLVGAHQRNGSSQSGGSSSSSSSLTVQLNVPIYQGGRVVSRTRQSRQLHRQALSELERARRGAERQTREAFLKVKSGIARVQALEQAVRSSESAAKSIEAGFQVGTRTSVDVLDAQRTLFQARRDVSAARYQYTLDVLRLKSAAGTLAESDIAQVDGWLE